MRVVGEMELLNYYGWHLKIFLYELVLQKYAGKGLEFFLIP